MSFRARPAAKLNLTLEVGRPGADGFHPLRSVFLRVGLSDRLEVGEHDGERDRLLLSGPVEVPQEGNLVLRAADLLRRRAGLPLPVLEIKLEKHIPAGGGLAGGSSDAAATLDLAAACWGLGLSPGERLTLAAMLGSDVPFFASAVPAALVEGRGELVTPLAAVEGSPGVLLASPSVAVATARAFATFDELGPPARVSSPTDGLVQALRGGLPAHQLPAWADQLSEANDLWPAAVRLQPVLGELRAALERLSQRAWLLTGSGSTLFSFYASAHEAAEAGQRIASERLAGLAGGRLYATDLEGPDPSWRQA